MTLNISDLKDKWAGQPALVVAGGPSVDECVQKDFPLKTIGTNYAHRVWDCDFVIPVKDYIYDDIRNEVEPQKIIAPSHVKDPHPDTILWEPAFRIESVISKPSNKLYTGKSGCTGGAIHLANILGASPIFAIGVDLGMIGKRYHSKGYWSTDEFKPMGWRQSLNDLDPVFNEQADHLSQIQQLLRSVGNSVYFVSPTHWRINFNG